MHHNLPGGPGARRLLCRACLDEYIPTAGQKYRGTVVQQRCALLLLGGSPGSRPNGVAPDHRQTCVPQTCVRLLHKLGPEGRMIGYKPIERHIRWDHEPTRLCDGQPAADGDILVRDMESLREARAEATLCPTCHQPSGHQPFSLRPSRQAYGKRTIGCLYTVPVQNAFDDIRNCAHCRENPGDRTRRAWAEARKWVRVLHREARRIARDVTGTREETVGRPAAVYQFVDGSVGCFALGGSPRLRERAGWPPSAAPSTVRGIGATGPTRT